MKQRKLAKILVCLFQVFCASAIAPAWTQANKDNVALQKMADEDQQERMSHPVDWTVLNRRDSIRRVKVFELIGQQALRTAKDYLNAGIVLQHGNDTLASAMAVKSFATAIQMDTTLNRWWYAAAVDRDLMRRAQPQIYGTQFIRDSENGKWYRYIIDSTIISDEQRKYYSVETLSEQVEKEYLMNQKSLSDYYKACSSLEQTIEHIKLIYKRGRLAAGSLEAEINQLGYEFLSSGNQEAALSVFKLNTQLYPLSANAFDSYGEGLMVSGKKKAALKAYRKSLKLNPQNEHAKQILKAGRQSIFYHFFF